LLYKTLDLELFREKIRCVIKGALLLYVF